MIKAAQNNVNNLVTVDNIHSHKFTCYKYGKKDGCRFGFPREIVDESDVKDGEIGLKRLDSNINNYNLEIMNCVRSNNDIKFIPSGKE